MQNTTDTQLSKAQNSINVNNNYASTTRDCKSFKYHNVIIANKDFERMKFDDFNLYCTMKIHNKKEYNAYQIEELSTHKRSRPTILKRFKNLSNLGLSSIRYIDAEIGCTSKISLNITEAPKRFVVINPTIIFDVNLSEKHKFYLAHILFNNSDFIDNPKFIDEMCKRLNIKRETFLIALRQFNKFKYINFEENRRDKKCKFLPPRISILPKARPYKNVEKTVEKHVDNTNDYLKENPGTVKVLCSIDTKGIDKQINLVLGSDEPKTEFKNVFKELRKELGEGIYQNNLSKCTFEIQKNELTITTPTTFVENKLNNYHQAEIIRAFKQHFNTKFELRWEVDKDCIPNKELLVEEETSNIQSSVVVLEEKRNDFRRFYNKMKREKKIFRDLKRKIERDVVGYEVSDKFVLDQVKLFSLKEKTSNYKLYSVGHFIATTVSLLKNIDFDNHWYYTSGKYTPRLVANF